MREIKFRAWDGTKNKWLHSTARAISMIGETVLFGAVLQRPDDSFVRLSELNEVEWEQFTGLHDKNGKEIYENDFVYIAGSGITLMSWPFIDLYEAGAENDIGQIKGNVHTHPEM